MSLLSSEDFKNGAASMELPVPIGMRVDRKIEILDLAKLPHLLIAGESKGEVSKVMHSIILSLMTANIPGSVHLMMLNNKVDTLCIYKDMKNPYMVKLQSGNFKKGEVKQCQPETIEEAEYALQSLVAEMEKRYADMAEMKCRDIYEYRKKFTFKGKDCIHEFCVMQCIVLFIDEYSDFISGKSKQSQHILELILQLASKGRKAGIHLVMSTSTINASVISGLIKANFPTRIALKVESASASRIIFDMDDALYLNDHRDAIVETDDKIVRVQIGSLDSEEILNAIDATSTVPWQIVHYKLPDPS